LEKANPSDQPATEPIYGIIVSPKPFKMRFIPRE